MPIYENLTVDEAIQEGLQVLGITKDQAVIEVLDEGKKGFLGLGKNKQGSPLKNESLKNRHPLKKYQQNRW